jgi:hypothetical protein
MINITPRWYNIKLVFLIAYSSIASVLVPLGIAILHGKTMPKEFKPLYLTLVISLTCDISAFFLVRYSINTHWIGNIYLAAQFSLLVLIFRKQFHLKRTIDIIFAFFILFFVVNISFFQGPLTFNSVSNVVASLVLIGFCLFYFYRLLNDLPIIHIHQLPMLWISFAVLTYYGGNFFLFLVKNYLTYGDAGSHKLMWILHNLLNIIKNILFAVALWQSYRQARQYTLSSSAP